MFSTYQRLGLSVYATPRQVIRAAKKALSERARKGPLHRQQRHRFYRSMLAHHADARRLCTMFKL